MGGHGGKYVAAVALACFFAAGLGAFAVATPYWYHIDADKHLRLGFFQYCEHEEGINEFTRCKTNDFPSEFCGNKKGTLQMRHVWTAIMAMLSCLCNVVCGVMCVYGYCVLRFHTKTIMLISVLSAILMAAALGVFAHTYDGWLYCGYNYCTYAQHYLGLNVPCSTSYGYSYVLAQSSLAFTLVASLACAFHVRFLRCGYLDNSGNVTAKVLARKQTFLKKLRSAQSKELTRLEMEQLSPMRKRKQLPAAQSSSPDRNVQIITSPQRGGKASSKSKKPAVLSPSPWVYSTQHPRTAALSPSAVPFNNNPSATPQRAGVGSGSLGRREGTPNRNEHPTVLGSPSQPPQRIGEDGSWVYDAATGMYWSDKEQLYLKAEGKQVFFDPASGMWNDPETGEWTEMQPEF